jgi:uncharacterized protein YutE (UPF0331/DUF86 family)
MKLKASLSRQERLPTFQKGSFGHENCRHCTTPKKEPSIDQQRLAWTWQSILGTIKEDEKEVLFLFITDQHRTQIQSYLDIMDKQSQVLRVLKAHSFEEFQNQPVLQAAAQRALHIALECLTDIGNIIIDALIMRDPASYEDIFLILTEEGVFEQAFADHFIGAVRFRKTLVHEYRDLTAENVYEKVQAHAEDFDTIRSSIAKYVKLS